MLIFYPSSLELRLVFLIVYILEDVLEAPVIGFQDRVLRRKIERPAAVEAVVEAGMNAVRQVLAEVGATDVPMDAAAVALCRDNNIPIVVFNIRQAGNLAEVLDGRGTATVVQSGE